MLPDASVGDALVLVREVESFLAVVDHLAEVQWFLDHLHVDVLDLGTVLDGAAHHLRLAIGVAETAWLT